MGAYQSSMAVFLSGLGYQATPTSPTSIATTSSATSTYTSHTSLNNALDIVTSINVTAIIDPTHATSGVTATFSPLTSSPTGAAHYLFSFGDSYTSTGFDLSGTKPSPMNPFGNPAYPGLTDEPGMQNWIDLVTIAADASTTTMTYNFAEGGAAVNNSLTDGANANVPAFWNQSVTFLDGLATQPRKAYAPWTAANSAFVVWFGRNDIYWQTILKHPLSRLDEVQNSLLLILTHLVGGGAQRFLVLGCPPMEREPLWLKDQFAQYKGQLPPAVAYWNDNLPTRLERWQKFYPDVKLDFLDIAPIFNDVLDHPATYGAPSALCTNEEKSIASGVSNGTNCLWADGVHPGPALNQEVANAVGIQLQKIGYLPAKGARAASATGATCASAATGAPKLNSGAQRDLLTWSSLLGLCLLLSWLTVAVG